MNDILEYDFAEAFSKNPGLRFKSITPGTLGEEFRDNVLEKFFEQNQKIRINVNNIESSLGASFLSEAFGNIAVKYGIKKFNEIISFDTSHIKGQINYQEMGKIVQEAIKRSKS